jgi:DNA-binding CsgD family transcriptional regulator
VPPGARDGEAEEGLSWAAWWLDDAEAALGARERAYRLYRAEERPVPAARMATWLACDELDFHGALAVAQGWLGRAHALVDPLPTTAEHGWLAFFEGYIALALGDDAAAAELAGRALGLGRRLGVPDLEMLGLALDGALMVRRARVAEGMRRLDEAAAVALADEAELPIAGAWTLCFLVSSCTAARDHGRALEWCDRIAGLARRYGSRYMLAFCRAEYGAIDLWRGRWDKAQALLENAIEHFSRSRPGMAGEPMVALAELRRRQGRWEEAEPLLDRAPPSGPAQLCRARRELDRGAPAAAAELAERVLRATPADRALGRAAALELLVRARAAEGRPDAAGPAVAELRGVARSAGTTALRGAADLAAGVVAAARGDHDLARPLLEDAVDALERDGGVFEAAQARVELASTLLALGRFDAAAREAAAARNRLRDLGADVDATRAGRVLDACAAAAGGRGLAGLTPREREVLELVADGLTNREIADRLVVSPHTVHRHVANILRKLGLPSRAAAAAEAARGRP